MKNLLIILLLLICSTTSAGLKLTINGFVDENNTENDYVVFHVDGKTQQELYTSVLQFLVDKYNSPKDVIYEIKYDMIKVHGFRPDIVTFSGYYDLDYQFSIKIKDGKIRVDSPTFVCTRSPKSGMGSDIDLYSKGAKWSLFNKNGTPRLRKQISQIEVFFNNFCSQLMMNLTKQQKDDW